MRNLDDEVDSTTAAYSKPGPERRLSRGGDARSPPLPPPPRVCRASAPVLPTLLKLVTPLLLARLALGLQLACLLLLLRRQHGPDVVVHPRLLNRRLRLRLGHGLRRRADERLVHRYGLDRSVLRVDDRAH